MTPPGRLILPAIALLLLASAFLSREAGSQTSTGPSQLLKREQGLAGDAPVLIKADELSHDEELGIVLARGNVEISQGDRILMADSVSYNQKTDTVSASGNVTILEPTGDVMFAEYAELTDEFRNGIIRQLRVLLADDSRFAATDARRSDGNRTIMRRGVYSPCLPCKEDPTRPLLWQIRADRIEHDEAAQDVSYHHAFLEMFGIPVAYTPYFTHPDPTVERRTGFLTPSFGTGGNVGGFVQIPYFIAIGDDKDVTLSPIYTFDDGLVLSGEYRQRFNKGAIEMSGSLTEADRERLDGTIERSALRGHGRLHGRYDIDRTWRAGVDAARSTDRTYLRRFNFFGPYEEVLRSNAYIEGFRPRTYAAANFYAFQEQRTGVRPDQPEVLPLLEFSHVSDADRYGGRFNIDSDFRYLRRSDGPMTQRVSVRPAYQIAHTADAGHVTTFTASLRGDLYNVKQTDDPSLFQDVQSTVTGRLVPRATIDWRYPFVRDAGSIRQLVEPVLMFTASPNGQNPRNIPNEDSTVFEIDETNLLSEDRLAGGDLVETGQRFVYGMRFGAYGQSDARATAFLGQSYRLNRNTRLEEQGQIEDHLSDVVGRVEVRPNRYLDLQYRFAFATDDFQAKRNDLLFALGPPSLRFGGYYSFISATPRLDEREEVYGFVRAKLTERTSLVMSTQWNLAEGQALRHSASFVYEDECITFEVTGTRSFFRDIDLEPSDSVVFRIKFRNLGEVTAGAL